MSPDGMRTYGDFHGKSKGVAAIKAVAHKLAR